MTAPGGLSVADDLVRLASAEPLRARRDASELLASSGLAPEVRCVALRALGLACREIGDLPDAEHHLRAAIALAQSSGLDGCEAQARMSLMIVLADTGRTSESLTEAARAATVLRGVDLARLQAQEALVHQRIGAFDQALALFASALGSLRGRDPRFEAGLLLNRGVLLAHLGRAAAAERDLVTCGDVAQAAGLPHLAAMARHNLGFAAARAGDLPRALALYDAARPALAGVGRRAEMTTRWDHADALLSARLADDAHALLSTAVTALDELGFASDASEARLALAHASLLRGDAAEARTHADAAAVAFRDQGRPAWAVLAGYATLAARWADGERTAALAHDARATAVHLDRVGWAEPAQHARLIGARVLLTRGRLDEAASVLSAAEHARRRGSATVRAGAWYAQALLREAQGDRRGACAALRAGLRVVEDHAASLGATDLRVHAAGLGEGLATAGVRLALDSRRARAVLRWAERWRATALRRRPVRPPTDPEMAADLAALRHVVAEAVSAGLEGRNPRPLTAERARLERAIRDRSRHAPSHGRAGPEAFDVAVLVSRLGDRALVEYVRCDGQLHAVVVSGGRVRVRALGLDEAVAREVDSLRFALHRTARRHGTSASLAAAHELAGHAAARLDELLVRPLGPQLGERELVLVPTGVLHAVPWPVLPSLHGRPVSVVPSATSWLAGATGATTPRLADRGTVLVSGPGLVNAEPEVRALAPLHPGATLLTGPDASAEKVAAALDGAGLAHVASHGRFRADNPQFSCLEMADGGLTVYDLERLHVGPRLLVLSACDAGLSAVHPGDELMGLASALLSLGTQALVASVVPVDDESTERLMVDLHRRLVDGAPPARALAEAGASAQVAGFVCFGAG